MSEFPFDDFKETDFNEFERFFKTNTVNPIYDHRANFQTNSPSFYEYLAKHNHLMKILAKRIYDYDKELAKRFEEWDKRIENLPDELEELLIEWLSDGTLEEIINVNIFNGLNDKINKTNNNLYRVNLLEYDNTLLGKDITNTCNEIIDRLHFLGGGTLYIPEGEYLVNGEQESAREYAGIKLKSNVSLITHENTILRLIPNDKNWSSIISVNNASNVSINVGYLFGDRSQHLSDVGEWGHGIALDTVKNINVKFNKISDCWGDAVYLRNFENIDINCKYIDNCRRQGISVIFGNNLNIKFKKISNINGTKPMSAIDIENNNTGEPVSNIYVDGEEIENCRFGYQLYPNKEHFKNIYFKNTSFNNCEQSIIVSGAVSGSIENINFENMNVNGTIEVGKSYIDKSNITFKKCININYIKLVNAKNTKFFDCEIKETSYTTVEDTYFEGCRFNTTGRSKLSLSLSKNTHFNNCLIENGERPIQTHNFSKITIENCHFKNTVDGAIGSEMKNIIIRNNVFENCNPSVVASPDSLTNISLIDNIFINSNVPHISVNAEDSVYVNNIVWSELI